MVKVVVIGAGAFGTAIACTVSHDAEQVILLVRDEDQASSINTSKSNKKYLPDFRLPNKVNATTDIVSVAGADVVFLATPAGSIDKVCESIRHLLKETALVVNLAKGLHPECLTLDVLIRKMLPATVTVAALKGPNFARPLIQGAPSGMTLAMSAQGCNKVIKNLFKSSVVTVEDWYDLSAVEFISAIKNVLAIVMGICDATEDNPNTRFMIVKKLFDEANFLLRSFGYDPSVMLTYAGCGDLLMTALNDTSRNRTLGLLIGRGFGFSNVDSGPITEGRRTVSMINNKMNDIGDRHDVFSSLEDVFKERLTPQEFFWRITRTKNILRNVI